MHSCHASFQVYQMQICALTLNFSQVKFLFLGFVVDSIFVRVELCAVPQPYIALLWQNTKYYASESSPGLRNLNSFELLDNAHLYCNYLDVQKKAKEYQGEVWLASAINFYWRRNNCCINYESVMAAYTSIHVWIRRALPLPMFIVNTCRYFILCSKRKAVYGPTSMVNEAHLTGR